MKLTKKQMEYQLRRAKRLLAESVNYLDRDFNWQWSDAFEKRVIRFVGDKAVLKATRYSSWEEGD